MLPDELYALALNFKREKLWSRLRDSQLFALSLPSGNTGFCTVMGKGGTHYALALYRGKAGLRVLNQMAELSANQIPLDSLGMLMIQDTLMVSFENREYLEPEDVEEVRAFCRRSGMTIRGAHAWPKLVRYEPQHIPWFIDSPEDQQDLACALRAAIAVSHALNGAKPEQLGFTDGLHTGASLPLLIPEGEDFVWSKFEVPKLPEPEDVPVCRVQDELLLRRLCKKHMPGTLLVHIFLSERPTVPDEDVVFNAPPKHAPFFPYYMLLIEPQSMQVLMGQVTPQPGDYTEGFTEALLDAMKEMGAPRSIVTANRRSYAFMKEIAPKLNAQLTLDTELPGLDELIEDFLNFDPFYSEDQQDYDIDDEDAEDPDFPGEMMSSLITFLGEDPDTACGLPDEFLMMLDDMGKSGCLPDNIYLTVKRELKRRRK